MCAIQTHKLMYLFWRHLGGRKRLFICWKRSIFEWLSKNLCNIFIISCPSKCLMLYWCNAFDISDLNLKDYTYKSKIIQITKHLLFFEMAWHYVFTKKNKFSFDRFKTSYILLVFISTTHFFEHDWVAVSLKN